jgi:DNA helicase-2/ATP-dependent DNA helicase PcrA
MKTINNLPCFVTDSISLPKAAITQPGTSATYVPSNQSDAHYFRLLESKGIYLNQNQVDAVRANTGPILINSIPGSGKSTVVTCKIGYLISVKDIKPENILSITFTRKAALSLNCKLQELNILGSMNVLATTFHSLCLKIMKLSGLKKVTLLSSDKHKEYIIRTILKELKKQENYPLEKLLTQLSYIKTSIKEAPIDEDLLVIFNKYEEYKKANNLLDFDDLLFNGWKILKASSYVLKLLQNQFKYITVDEYQDLCSIEHDIVKMLVNPLNNLCAVGDSAQNIFSFRGSNPSYILNFEKEYPNAKTLNLNVNYRSTAPIIGLSDLLLKSISFKRTSLAVKDSNTLPQFINASDSIEEAKLITDKIVEMVRKNNISPKDIGILFRSSSCNEFITEELTINNLPFIEYNSKELLYNDPVIKPLINYLRLTINPKDVTALSGVLGTLYMNKSITLSWLNQNNKCDEPLLEALLYMPTLKDYQYEILSNRQCLLTSIQNLSPLNALRKLRCDFYDRYLKINDSSVIKTPKESIIDMLSDLEASASRFNNIPEFLEYVDTVTLKHTEAKNNMSNENINAISLMSIHRSKGLQFRIVFILSVIENVIPHKRVMDEAILSNCNSLNKATLNDLLDEEARLLYVAITRAEQELYISIPRHYHDHASEASRFLRDAFSFCK